MQHLICKETLEITLPSSDGAAALQEEARRILLGDTMRAVDELLSELSDDELVAFDRIEIDLGAIHASFLQRDLVEGVRLQLREALLEELSKARETKSGPRAKTMSLAESKLEAIGHFLLTGRFPWWTPASWRSSPEAILSDLLDESPRELCAIFRQPQSDRMCIRLIGQFPAVAVDRVLSLLAGSEAKSLIADWATLIQAMAGLSVVVEDVPAFVRRCVLTCLVVRQKTDFTLLSHDIASAAAKLFGLDVDAMCSCAREHAAAMLDVQSPVLRWLKANRVTSAQPNSFPEALASPHRRCPAEALQDTSENESAMPAAGAVESMDGERSGQIQGMSANRARGSTEGAFESAEDSYVESLADAVRPVAPAEIAPDVNDAYVENAGLILLWPFLAKFFRAVSYLDRDAFLSTMLQERAVLLLQNLAAGSAEASEHVLLLNKVICGLQVEEPVPRKIDLTDVELRESGELLKSVVAHWKSLKGTSVDGFRRSFLAREGRLVRQENGWRLTVQRVGYDVLLESLPWAIGIVVLPWMKEPLFVEW